MRLKLMTLCMALCCLCLNATSQNVPNYVPTDGLVAWYPFNGNANDESGNENDGEIMGPQLTADRFGLNESAFEFENTRIEIANSADLDQFKSISFWFSTSSTAGNQVMFKQNIYSGHVHERVSCAVNWSGNAHFAAKEVCDATWQYDNVGVVLNDGMWHHYVGVLDSIQKRLYIDGVLLDESSFVPETMCSGADLIIGQEWDGVPYDFIGTLDDFGFWNRALIEDEILALYNAQFPFSGCTDSTSCNFNAEATSDDGSCLSIAELSLEDQIQIDSSGQLILVTPETLQNWTWDNGTSGSSIPIGSGGTFSIQGAIGDIPDIGSELNEGLVFAVDASNQIVYIASPEEIGTGSEWGCYGTPTGATGQGMGDGIINTQLMLENCSDENAAVVASDYGENWYLPSFEELDVIRTQLHDNGFGDYSMDNPLSYNWYWSSSECSENPHWAAGSMHFSDGFYGACNNKNSNPGGVIAAKMVQGEFCHFSDTITIEVDCSEIMDLSANSTSCGPGTYWDELESLCLPIETCQEDLDGDGVIGINDLMELLSSFGTMCEEPETGEFTCGDPMNYHGYDYATVQIGDQCWFAENLRTEHYANGDAIPGGLSNSEWSNAGDTNLGAQAVYNNDESNISDYGRLFNWYAVGDSRGLCPSDWHVPTDGEFMTLEMELGMSESEANGTGWRGTDQGTQMKSSSGDNPTWNGTNTSGFSGLAGGHRLFNGTFDLGGYNGYFWSSSLLGSDAWDRELFIGFTEVARSNSYLRYGFSVRCVED
jgi:uncharacterized protein (TIGR02145 family)